MEEERTTRDGSGYTPAEKLLHVDVNRDERGNTVLSVFMKTIDLTFEFDSPRRMRLVTEALDFFGIPMWWLRFQSPSPERIAEAMMSGTLPLLNVAGDDAEIPEAERCDGPSTALPPLDLVRCRCGRLVDAAQIGTVLDLSGGREGCPGCCADLNEEAKAKGWGAHRTYEFCYDGDYGGSEDPNGVGGYYGEGDEDDV